MKRPVKPNIPLSPKKTDKQQAENNPNDSLNPIQLSSSRRNTYKTAADPQPAAQSLYIKPIQAELETAPPEEQAPDK